MQPSSSIFPGVPGNVLVHNGFRDAHSSTAPAILAEVKKLITSKGATTVTTVSLKLGPLRVWAATDHDRP